MAESFDFGALDKVVKQTVGTIESSKNNIFEIAESAKEFQKRLENDVEQINFEVKEAIKKVDNLERTYQKSRERLMVVNRDFNKYTEEEIKKVYNFTQDLQVELAIEREREMGLRKRRDELVRTLVRIKDMSDKADDMLSKVDIAINYLSGNLNEFSQQMGEFQQKQFLGGKIIMAQEEERKRIAREIHDGPAQTMANVVLRAEYCERLITLDRAETVDELGSLKQVVRDSLQEIRRIIFNLRPMTLDDLGLIPTVKRYITEIKDPAKIAVELTINAPEFRMPGTYEIAFFRLIQECINNARKHSNAKMIKVILEYDEKLKVFSTEISDDGVGFDLNNVLTEVAGRESFGILSMKERFELLNGELEIQSQIGHGTQVIASIPIDKNA